MFFRLLYLFFQLKTCVKLYRISSIIYLLLFCEMHLKELWKWLFKLIILSSICRHFAFLEIWGAFLKGLCITSHFVPCAAKIVLFFPLEDEVRRKVISGMRPWDSKNFLVFRMVKPFLRLGHISC